MALTASKCAQSTWKIYSGIRSTRRKRRSNREIELLRGLQFDYELELRWLRDGKIGRSLVLAVRTGRTTEGVCVPLKRCTRLVVKPLTDPADRPRQLRWLRGLRLVHDADCNTDATEHVRRGEVILERGSAAVPGKQCRRRHGLYGA